MQPIAIERDGVLRSPDIAVPDSIPVAAGKNSAKAPQKAKVSVLGKGVMVSGIWAPPPIKTEMMATKTMTKIKPWAFTAKSTGRSEIRSSPLSVQISIRVREK